MYGKVSLILEWLFTSVQVKCTNVIYLLAEMIYQVMKKPRYCSIHSTQIIINYYSIYFIETVI